MKNKVTGRALLLIGILSLVTIQFNMQSVELHTLDDNWDSPESSTTFITITDMFDRQIDIPAQVDRVVGTGAGALRYIVYMGGTEKVCGVENIEREEEPDPAAEMRPYFFAHPELAELPSVGDKWGGDPELIVQAAPDVVITTNEVQEADLNDLQTQIGIPVIGLVYGDLDTNRDLLWEGLNITAQVLGTEDRYQSFRIYLEDLISDLNNRTEAIPDEDKESCYIGGVSYRGGHGIDSTKPNFDSFDLVHAKNVAGNLSLDHAFIDSEQLLMWDPEIIFIDGGGFILTVEDLNSGIFDTLHAVRTDKIHVLLPYNSYTANFGSILVNSYYIGKILYPTAFEDVNITQKAATIYETMVGANVLDNMTTQFQYYAQTTQVPLNRFPIDTQASNNIAGFLIGWLSIGTLGIIIILMKYSLILKQYNQKKE